MQEIVPPKLNKDTGILSLFLNRRNLIIALGIGASFMIWTSSRFNSDTQTILELAVIFCLAPFLFDVYGRPMHIFIKDFFKYIFSRKQKTITEFPSSDSNYIKTGSSSLAKVYRIEPVNLSMSSEEEVYAFKRYIQQALFALTEQIQLLTIQRYSVDDSGLDIEEKRLGKLKGILKKRRKEYLEEYSLLSQTIERSFYLVISAVSRNEADAIKKIDDQENSFGRLLEQSKIKLIPLEQTEVSEISRFILQRN